MNIFGLRHEIVMASKKLTIVENTTPGFFDPVSLASEVHISLKPTRSGQARTASEERLAYSKARSTYVARCRKSVLDAFLLANKHVRAIDLERRVSANHPVCMHPLLIGETVKKLYPNGGVHVEEADVAWISGRAPVLPPRDVEDCAEEDAQRSLNDTEPSTDHDEDRATNRTGSLILDSRVVGSSRRWWTDTSQDDISNDFTCTPPWHSSSRQRLVNFDLPRVNLTVDPETGLVRASDITTHFDARMNYWLHLGISSNDDQGTRGLAFALANDMRTTPNKLVYCTTRGPNVSTWVNIHLAVDLARWCSPTFSVHVNKVLLRYHSGQITSDESHSAARAVNASIRSPEVEGDDIPTLVKTPASSSNHRLVRATARRQSTRGPRDVRDIPIPHHLLTTTGVYIGAWGVVDDGSDAPWWHLKIGKASEQPVTMRVRAHYAEKPHTFVLLFVAGCDGGLCHAVELALKHQAARVMGLASVANSDEEFKVPVDALDRTVGDLKDEVCRRHGDILTLDSDVPAAFDVEKCRIEAHEQTKRYALDQILRMSDDAARDRAIHSVLHAC